MFGSYEQTCNYNKYELVLLTIHEKTSSECLGKMFFLGNKNNPIKEKSLEALPFAISLDPTLVRYLIAIVCNNERKLEYETQHADFGGAEK